MYRYTVTRVVEHNLCTGCATCVGTCPERALSVAIDRRRGVYVPKVDAQKCNNCGLCQRVCPGYETYFDESNFRTSKATLQKNLIGDYSNCYVGHSVNPAIVDSSSSGGLVTQLLIYALDEGLIDGALVTRMREDDPLQPESFIAKTREEILSAAKSKYCPVPANIALREILETPGKYAMVGLPCHIQGARKAEQCNKILRDRLIFHLGLVCNHAPTFLATDHLLKKLGIPKHQVKRIEYRSKGQPSDMVITLKDGEVRRVNHNSSLFWGGSFSDFFYSPRCTVCADKMCEFADISFMDAWLPEYSKYGARESMAISITKLGEELLQSALSKKIIELKKIPVEKIVKGEVLVSSRKRYSARARILQQLHRDTPIYHKPLSKVGMRDYLSAASWPLRFYVSENPSLWFIIDLYIRFAGFAR